MKNLFWLLVMLLLALNAEVVAQGPPITGDKPIMLGANRLVLKTLTEIRKTDKNTIVAAPLRVHYLPTSNMLVGLHVPFVFHKEEGSGSTTTASNNLGDISLLLKYQFFRKDQTGKTLRLVAKTLQGFPTGKALDFEGISTKTYQSYQGLVLGYESLRYGISNELGFNLIPENSLGNEVRHKLGFGLPLLKQTYPVNQINLYFEYQSSWFWEQNGFRMLYAQGIQYAKGNVTIEASVQLPLIQTATLENRKYSVLIGSRYVF